VIHYLGILNPRPFPARGDCDRFFMSKGIASNPQSGFNALQGVILIFIVLVLVIVVLSAYSSSRATARDAKRISDVSQLQKAIRYYYEEFGQYPQASTNGQAVGVDNSFSRFLSPWPTAPQPADGSCTAQTNVYYYEQLNSGENYQIKFCLGKAYGRLPAGQRIVSPSTIQ
jgi:hypothetical protein